MITGYRGGVPRLWTDTVETHRREVRDAILDTAAALAAEHGLRGVTMSQIAEEAGIGRATLYRYFPDVEAILVAWHDRQTTGHLAELAEVSDRSGGPSQRLEGVLNHYALTMHQTRRGHSAELTSLLHQDEHVQAAERQLRDLVRELIIAAADAGEVRTDVNPDELTTFCLHALNGASALASKAAVRRLVVVTLTGLQPD
jgi:AcrR family transcriptional regulator